MQADHERVAEFLRITFDTMDQAVTIYDGDFRLVACNERYREFGLVPEKYTRYGASLIEAYGEIAHLGAFGEGDPAELAERHIRALRDGPLIENELLYAPDGRTLRIRRFRLENGGVCATFADVTEELMVQEQLRQSTKMDAIGRLTGGVAHDMNNVLASIMGNLELEEETRGNSPHLTSALDAAGRGARLTHRLLAFARKQPLRPAVIEPGSLVKELVSMLRSLLGETIDLEIVCDAGLWKIEVDQNQLENVLVNASVNARDAMPKGGKLTIEAANARIDADYAEAAGVARGQYVCLSITDTGTGMSADIVEQAFEPFFTTKKPGAGTGLGLAMAHGFVKQSNGHIKLYSEPGVGTTLRVYLPRTHATAERAAPEPAVAGSLTIRHRRVLIVEDDALFRETIYATLTSSGYTAVTASDGHSALDTLASDDSFDILLTDVVLPGGINGRQVAEAATRLKPTLKVIYMSGYSENAIIHHGRLDPGVVLLQKPFRKIDLIRELVRTDC